MTEKRFSLAYEKGNWWAVCDGDITLWKEEVIGLLNELNDENEHLKEIMGIMPNDNVDEVVNVFNCQEMEKWKFRKENEQLKSEYKVLHTQYHDLKKFVENNFDEYLTQEKLNRQIIKLSDENEQLKEDRNELFIRERDVKNNWRELKYENEQLKSENKRLKRLTASYIWIDINKVLPVIAECRGITVEEYLEEIEEEYTKRGKEE